MEFIEKLMELMKKENINTITLQKNTGISESTFRNWKKGSSPTAEKIIILSKYFKVTTDELLGLENNSISENEKELLELFRLLPEREQIKFIGRLEDAVEKYGKNNN